MIRYFSSTREAYNACQCDETVRDGDVLVILSERVVGLAETWPIAVTQEYGKLHQIAPEVSVIEWAAAVSETRKNDLVAAFTFARCIACESGWPVVENRLFQAPKNVESTDR